MDKFDIIIQGGQSNAEGFGLGPVEKAYIPNDKIYYLNSKKSCVWTTPAAVAGEGVLVITYFDEPFELFPAEERDAVIGKAGDFALSFAEEYIKNGYLEEGRKLLIVRGAVGGTGFVQTKEWGVGNILHEKLIEMSKYALDLNPENRVVAFLWHQGEHEAARGNSPTVYEQQLVDMVTDIRKRLNTDMVYLSADFVHDWRNKNAEKTLPIIESMKKATNRVGKGGFVESEGLNSNDQEIGNGDEIHFSRASLQILGKRYFEVYKKLRG